MSNVFINRNRSQGGYGLPIDTQKHLDLNETWYSRKPENQFFKTSLKYSNNLDLQNTKVDFQWTLNDTSDVMKPQAPTGIMDNATAFKWKQFNSFERKISSIPLYFLIGFFRNCRAPRFPGDSQNAS